MRDYTKKTVRTVSLTLIIPEEVSDWLKSIAEPQGKARSSVIRDILYDIYVRQLRQKEEK